MQLAASGDGREAEQVAIVGGGVLVFGMLGKRMGAIMAPVEATCGEF